MQKVLLVDDDAAVRDALTQTLELNDLSPIACASFVVAKDHITPEFEGVIVSDIRMPGRDGFHLLEYAREIDPALPVVLLTGEGDIPMAVRAMSEGAVDFLEKPCATADLLAVLQRALQTRALVLENRQLKRQLESGDPAARLLLGVSPLAEELRRQVRRVAPTPTEVLITGPTGSGVSKVAEVIHLMSSQAQGAFIKRAATGVKTTELDLLMQEAAGGTLFLDDIQSLPIEAQTSLVYLLDDPTSPRLIAGSTADLPPRVENGSFSADLYYRLEGMRVRIPALSERPSDIPPLFRHYVVVSAEQAGLAVPEIDNAYLTMLMTQDWPGNTRSLMSAAMRFVLGMPEEVTHADGLGLAEQLAQVERSILIAALGRQNGRAAAAAQALQVPRKTFYDKLARYGIRPEDYRR